MALRSLLRKTPALGVRSWPTAMGAVQKLSPAAGSRLVSTDLPSAEEGRKVYSQEEIDEMRAEFDETMKEIKRDIAALGETCRADDAEGTERFRKQHENINRTCNVILLLCVPATILISRI
uniref:Uncharacterized protein n=1 Tax=Avena sativa TaxID=4498 RepID=A0ACD5UG06_AVESA